MLEKYEIFDIAVTHPSSKDRILADVSRDYNNKILIALNSDKAISYKDNIEDHKLLNNALTYCDGIGIVWALKRKYDIRAEKIPGVELYLDILSLMETKGVPIALIGGSDTEIELVKKCVQGKFPLLRISYIRNGYFEERCWSTISAEIFDSGAKFIFAGLGSPLQERFLHHVSSCYKIGGMGVGGSFKVLTGQNTRAPSYLLHLNLEFLYRYATAGVKWSRILSDLRFFFHLLYGKTL